MTFDNDNLDIDNIDFKRKRGKSKGMSPKRWSLYIIEGIIVLVAVVAGGRFLFSDNANASDLQATIDARPTQPPSLTTTDLFETAMIEKSEGLTADAIQSLTYAIGLDPTFADAYFERAELYYDQNQYYQASQDYESALRHGYEDMLYANFRLGLARFEREDYWNAIDAFDEVIAEDGDYTEAYYWRGRALAESGSYEEGIADMLLALEMGYDEPVYAYFFIAGAYDDLEDYDRAIANYTRALEYSEEDCEAYYCWIDYNNRGTTYYWLGDFDEAIADYTRAIQVNPDEYPLALKNRGDAYDANGETTAALSDWNTMFQLVGVSVQRYELTGDRQILRETLSDKDAQAHIEFDGSVGDVVTIAVTIPETSNLNTMLMLRDPDDNPVAYAAPYNESTAQLNDIVLSKDGAYTIVVASDLGNTSGGFVLALEK